MPKTYPRETVAYVLKRFPVLSETFILNEILALEERGTPVHIFSLERPNDPRFHEKLPQLKAAISYVPAPTELSSLIKYKNRAAKRYGDRYREARAYALRHRSASLYWRLLQSCYIVDQVRRYRIGHFHAHFATRATSVAFFASMLTGLPYSFTAHAMDIFKSHLSTNALARKIHNADFVVTISEHNRALLEEVAGDDAGKIKRIYNGIDLEQFRPNGVARKDPFTFLCVARLVEKKGHTVLLDACHLLKQRGVNFQCWMVGKGRLRSPLQQKIKELDLMDCVHLLGAQRQGEVLERYHEAHAYVLPCLVGSDGNRDGLPVSVVEALACGLPVITTPMTGIPEVVRNEENGLLVPEEDSLALADAMERAVNEPRLYETMSSGARPSVGTMFDLRETIKDLNDLFQESLA